MSRRSTYPQNSEKGRTVEELQAEAVLPHERWAELERENLQDRLKRPRAMPARLPTAGGGEETSRHYNTLRLSIPLMATLAVPVVLLYVGPFLLPALMTMPLWSTPGAVETAWIIVGLVLLLSAVCLCLLWVFRDQVAETWARRRAMRLRRMRRDLILGAFGRNCDPMTQIGVRYGLQRSEPPGSFHDFIGFLELADNGIEVWWAKGKQAGGFLIPRSWIVRIWPVEVWTKGASASVLGPPTVVVPYVEFRDPRTGGVRILSMESAEAVTPAGIIEGSRILADRLCGWLYGQAMERIWVPPADRAMSPLARVDGSSHAAPDFLTGPKQGD
jgi:hypothetical protein